MNQQTTTTSTSLKIFNPCPLKAFDVLEKNNTGTPKLLFYTSYEACYLKIAQDHFR